MNKQILKEWLFHCLPCDKKFGLLAWNYELDKQLCPSCNSAIELYEPDRVTAPGIVPDGIPGGVEIKHLSNKPERFYSRTEIKRACNERGFNWADDSPQPYKVQWSGKRTNESPAK